MHPGSVKRSGQATFVNDSLWVLHFVTLIVKDKRRHSVKKIILLRGFGNCGADIFAKADCVRYQIHDTSTPPQDPRIIRVRL